MDDGSGPFIQVSTMQAGQMPEMCRETGGGVFGSTLIDLAWYWQRPQWNITPLPTEPRLYRLSFPKAGELVGFPF